MLEYQSINNIGEGDAHIWEKYSWNACLFSSLRNLAIGIGIQNFPEGLAVSLPLRGAGVSMWTAFWWGEKRLPQAEIVLN